MIVSHDLSFAQNRQVHLYSHYVSIVNAFWIMIVAWIHPKELALTVHTSSIG